MRQTLDDTGTPLGVVSYNAWGTPETGAVPTFGFTGELQDAATGLVNLRARWYATGNGTFTSRDTFAGDPQTPYSQHPYQYGSSDPIGNTDPTGHCAERGQGDDYCQTNASNTSAATPTPMPAPGPLRSAPPATPTPTPPPPPAPGVTYSWGSGWDCIGGFTAEMSYNALLGTYSPAAAKPHESYAMTVCRKVGDVGSMLQGAAEITGGEAIAGIGVISCTTVVLCFVGGGVAAVGGVAIAAHGASTAVYGTWNLTTSAYNCLAAIASGGRGGGGPPPTPVPSSSLSGGGYSKRKLGDLQPLHPPGSNRTVAERLRNLSDQELLDSVLNPPPKESVKVRPGENVVIDGNTRLYEIQRRMQQNPRGVFRPNLEIPVFEEPKGSLDPNLPDDY